MSVSATWRIEFHGRARQASETWLISCAIQCTALLILGASISSATAQTVIFPASVGTGTEASDADSALAQRTSSSNLAAGGISGSSTALLGSRQVVLSAAQIGEVLEVHPDAIVELKQLVADRLSQNGSAVQDSDISDDLLYTQIASSPDLRTSITGFLLARGYIDESEVRGAASPTPDMGIGATVKSGGDVWDDADTAAITGNTSPSPPDREVPASRNIRGRKNEAVQSSTAEPQVLRVPAPYNLRSMRDLYTQLPESNAQLKRFGSELFTVSANAVARGIQSKDLPLDVPIGPDYVLGAGDSLTINLWGAATQTFTRTVDRDGRILLPEAGSISVSGLTLGDTQKLLESALERQYRNAHLSVTVSRLHSVRVYVVGDVQRPGAYDISALASPLSALFAAGGPTASGSLRIVRHLRGGTNIEQTDLYQLLLDGVRPGSSRFESGDTLLVPPAGAQVAVSGAVLRPAIYELKPGEGTLKAALDHAGGTTVVAALDDIVVERIDANQQRTTVKVAPRDQTDGDMQDAIARFVVKDGDQVRVSSILPYSERVIYLEGHVARPGRLAYSDGMQLADVLHSYRDMLPEPAAKGELVRLVAPDLHAETISFDLSDVLIGNSRIALQPFDTIRVFGRYQADAPKVTINGEVLRPGTFPLSEGMTAAQLVRQAGGFKRDAYIDVADLTSYSVIDGRRVTSDLRPVHIGAAVNGTEKDADVQLKPGDILTVHQVTGWTEIGESVTLQGQVAYPGNYGLREGERLSSVLMRAGGFRGTAYLEGTVLVREDVRQIEEKSRQELIRQIETSSAAARLSPTLGSETPAALQLIKTQQDEILAQLKSQPPAGRLVVHISDKIESWANTPSDIELRRGDVITIPKRPGFVVVTGQVYNPTALTFAPGKSAGWYLGRAGGSSSSADRREIFVIRANGSVIGRRSGGWLGGDVLSTKLSPGDVVVVPQKILGASQLWKNLLTTAQLASSLAITIAVAAL